MIFKTNDGYPAKPSSAPTAGTPPQTHYQRPPMPPAVQYPQQPPSMPPEVAQWFAQNGGYPMMQQQQAVVVRGDGRRTSHAFHLIMSLITFGLWIPVWVIMWIVNGGR